MKNNSIAFTIDASDYESASEFLRTIRDTLKNEKLKDIRYDGKPYVGIRAEPEENG